MEVFGAGEGFGNDFGKREIREAKVNVKLGVGPGHDVHVGAGLDLAREGGKGGEEAAQEVLQTGLRIPDVRRGDNEEATWV